MLVRNLLKAGDYVEPLPFGLPVTLRYKSTGNLEYAVIGYDDAKERRSDIVYSTILKHNLAPTHLGTNNGTVYVRGVLYSGKLGENLGIMPESQVEEMIEDIKSEVEFNFFAGNVYATSIKFGGPAQIRRWLQSQRFNILPGILVPAGDVNWSLRKQLDCTAFDYDLVVGYFIYRGSDFSIEYLDNSLDLVNAIDVYLDQSGCVMANIKLETQAELAVSYIQMLNAQLYTGNKVILDSSKHIISKYPKPENKVSSGSYTCPFCGKQYIISDEFAKCPDVHCLSRSYFEINHFLSRLNLINISYDRYLEAIQEGKLTKFSDILLLEEFSDLEITASLYDIVDGVIPIEAVRNRDNIWRFVSQCNNSWDSVIYYLDHPTAITSDLKIDCIELVTWLQDTENRDTIKEIVMYSNIILTSDTTKFEGSPIFRGKKIWLTGKFVHGSYSEVESILRSYSAEIVKADNADCCIIGDIPEDIEGSAVNRLKDLGKPIFNETDFFKMYDIDSDLV